MTREGVWIVCAVLVVVGFFGFWWSRNNGKFKSVDAIDSDDVLTLTPVNLGVELGDRLTVVQFSSTFCQPCVATKRVIARSLDMINVDGIASVEVNAEQNLELTRAASIMRTPTVLLLDTDGREVSRASGELRPQQFLAAIGSALNLDLNPTPPSTKSN